MGWGFKAIGETLSTGGREDQGDLAGEGAGAAFVSRAGVLSLGDRTFSLAAFWACCRSALAPSFKTVAFGPTLLANCGGLGLTGSSWWQGRGITSELGCSAVAGGSSEAASVVFVPSFHSIVSGAQSSSSSSMSAHLASLLSASACNLEVR